MIWILWVLLIAIVVAASVITYNDVKKYHEYYMQEEKIQNTNDSLEIQYLQKQIK